MEKKTQSALLLDLRILLPLICAVGIGSSCTKKTDLAAPADSATTTPTPTPSPTAPKYLYVASGACNAGPNTTFTNVTSSNLVYRLNTETGQRDLVLADYSNASANTGDSPVGIVDAGETVLVAVENTTTVGLRRIERIPKSSFSSRSTFSANITALATQLRSLASYPTGDLLVTRSAAGEYLTSSNVRIGAPYVNLTGASCGTTNTGVSRTLVLPSSSGAPGKIIFLNSATGQNRIGMMVAAGGNVCTTNLSVPSYPVAAFYDADNQKLIVAFAAATTGQYLSSIIAYNVNETTGVISVNGAGINGGNGSVLYDAFNFPSTPNQNYLLFNISEMTYDAATKTVYIATSNSTSATPTNYQIEKFSYDPTKISSTVVASNYTVLTKQATTFYQYGSDTKCISQMMIGN